MSPYQYLVAAAEQFLTGMAVQPKTPPTHKVSSQLLKNRAASAGFAASSQASTAMPPASGADRPRVECCLSTAPPPLCLGACRCGGCAALWAVLCARRRRGAYIGYSRKYTE
eukprot:6214470-Pleurochrysis_carterae.AAC.2